MKITKFIIPLVLGLAGGLIAYFIADNFGSKTIQSTLQHQIVGPGAVRPVVQKGVLWKSFGILVWRSTTPDA